MLKKILIGLLVTAMVLAGSMLIFIYSIGAWNIVFPNRSHDTQAPVIANDIKRPAILVFSKTNGFRHTDGINGGKKYFAQLAAKKGWGHFETENGAVFNAKDLARFDTVIFNSATGDMLSTEQEQAFKAWLEAGGGWLGVHAAADSSHKDWSWYYNEVIGVDFTAHIMGPQFQFADVIMEQNEHPVSKGIAPKWQHEEEWYSWKQPVSPHKFTVFAKIDEQSYTPEADFMGTHTDLRMGDHPIVWGRCVGQGRVMYSTMGHRASAYDNKEIRQLLENGLNWTNKLTHNECAK